MQECNIFSVCASVCLKTEVPCSGHRSRAVGPVLTGASSVGH